MKKVIVAVVIAAILVVGGYLILHDMSKPTTASNSTTPNAPAVNNVVLAAKSDPSLGQYLTDPSGNTLYTYGGDASGSSNCTGSCLVAWPAYQDKGSTTNLPTGVGTIKRSDNGQVQYTYIGMPLYYFASDGKAQVTGNGVQNFQVAKPAASNSAQPTPSSSGSSTSSGYPY